MIQSKAAAKQLILKDGNQQCSSTNAKLVYDSVDSLESVQTPSTSVLAINVEAKLNNDFENDDTYDNMPYHIISKEKKQQWLEGKENETSACLIKEVNENNVASTSNEDENLFQNVRSDIVKQSVEESTVDSELMKLQLAKYRHKVRIKLNKKLNLLIEGLEKQFESIELKMKNSFSIKYPLPWWRHLKNIDWIQIERRIKLNNLFIFSTFSSTKSCKGINSNELNFCKESKTEQKHKSRKRRTGEEFEIMSDIKLELPSKKVSLIIIFRIFSTKFVVLL